MPLKILTQCHKVAAQCRNKTYSNCQNQLVKVSATQFFTVEFIASGK